MRLSDRIALIRRGQLVQVGAPDELFMRPRDLGVARFFCELNEMESTARAGRVETALGAFPVPAGISDGPVVVAVRPKGVSLTPSGCGIAGRVVERRFLGEIDLVEVKVAGLERPVVVRTPDAGHAAKGREVGLQVDPAEVLVFAATGA